MDNACIASSGFFIGYVELSRIIIVRIEAEIVLKTRILEQYPSQYLNFLQHARVYLKVFRSLYTNQQ